MAFVSKSFVFELVILGAPSKSRILLRIVGVCSLPRDYLKDSFALCNRNELAPLTPEYEQEWTGSLSLPPLTLQRLCGRFIWLSFFLLFFGGKFEISHQSPTDVWVKRKKSAGKRKCRRSEYAILWGSCFWILYSLGFSAFGINFLSRRDVIIWSGAFSIGNFWNHHSGPLEYPDMVS